MLCVCVRGGTMSDDTTTTGLALDPVGDDITRQQQPNQDATQDTLGVNDRLAPPMIEANNAIYADSQIISAETQSSRRIVFRIPKTAILDIENSYLAFQINVSVNNGAIGSADDRVAISQLCFPSLVGGAGVIDQVITRIGQQEVQRIEDYAWWMASHYPQLTLNQQQFVRSHMDLSGTAYCADAYGILTKARNPFAMELQTWNTPSSSFSTNAANHWYGPKIEYAYQPCVVPTAGAAGSPTTGRTVQAHVTIPMMALCPSLFHSIKLYPAMAAEQLSIELVLSQDVGSILSDGLCMSLNSLSGEETPLVATKRDIPDAISSVTVEDPFLMCDFLSMPKPILDAINAQVARGLTRYAYTRYIKKQLSIAIGSTPSSKDVPIRVDQSILSSLLFLRKKNNGWDEGNTRLGLYQALTPFSQLNLNINNNNYFEKDLYIGPDFQLQTQRLMDSYHLPALVYDLQTRNSTFTKNADGKNSRWAGTFSPLGIDFLLEAQISRQPILVRNISVDNPTELAGVTFSDTVDVWIGRAESLILSATRSRVL